jgi:hypothetical protein
LLTVSTTGLAADVSAALYLFSWIFFFISSNFAFFYSTTISFLVTLALSLVILGSVLTNPGGSLSIAARPLFLVADDLLLSFLISEPLIHVLDLI